jgi:hypothetical protein
VKIASFGICIEDNAISNIAPTNLKVKMPGSAVLLSTLENGLFDFFDAKYIVVNHKFVGKINFKQLSLSENGFPTSSVADSDTV